MGQITNAFGQYNEVYALVIRMTSMSPQTFSSDAWTFIQAVNALCTTIGFALVAVLFAVGLITEVQSMTKMTWQTVAKALLILGIVSSIISHNMELMTLIYNFCGGMVNSIGHIGTMDVNNQAQMDAIGKALDQLSIFGQLQQSTQIGIWVLIMQLCKILITVLLYTRMIEIYMRIAFVPLSLAGFATKSTQAIARNVLQAYLAVCLQGAVILVSLGVYGMIMRATPAPTTDIISNFITTVTSSLVLIVFIFQSGRWSKSLTGLGG